MPSGRFQRELLYYENKVGASARISDCERRLKLAANGF